MDKHDSSSHGSQGASDHGHGGGHHIVPTKVYLRVFAMLITFTVLTVATSYIDFGGHWNILIAMGIATSKALLVILFFMGLRYDGQENNVTFFSAFVFLAIFVGLSGADLFYRPDLQAAKVDASELQQSGEPVDISKFTKATPEMVEKGKTIFGQQCVMCHGATGHGDGPAAAALNPKPRNFTQDQGWKNGRALAQIFKTVTEGLPGTPMPPFSGLSPADRFAVAHYVQSLGPAAPESSAEALAALQKQLGAGAKPRLSIETAMDKVAKEWEATHGK